MSSHSIKIQNYKKKKRKNEKKKAKAKEMYKDQPHEDLYMHYIYGLTQLKLWV